MNQIRNAREGVVQKYFNFFSRVKSQATQKPNLFSK